MSAIVSKNKVTGRSSTGTTRVAAQVSLASATVSLVSLTALHFLSPEFEPSWRMVSEYALGSYGWVLLLMFLSWALSCIALFVAIRSQVETLAGKIGLGFLLAAAIGMTLGGLFDVNHNLHGLAAMIGIPSLPVAAVLISISLSRTPLWSPARRSLLWTANLTWISLVLMTVGVFSGFSSTGEVRPDAWFGFANRLLILSYNVWLMVAAYRAMEISRQS
jgi:hypothetical protein